MRSTRMSHVLGWYSAWEDLEMTSMPISLHMVLIYWSRTPPKCSGSSSNVKHVVPHCLKSLGRSLAGCPRRTNNRELSFLRLLSKSSNDSRRNLWYFNYTDKGKNIKKWTAGLVKTYLHLLMIILQDPANQGSRMNIHRNVTLLLIPARKLGLSCSRKSLRNQCTTCFSSWFPSDRLIFLNLRLILSIQYVMCRFRHIHLTTCTVSRSTLMGVKWASIWKYQKVKDLSTTKTLRRTILLLLSIYTTCLYLIILFSVIDYNL